MVIQLHCSTHWTKIDYNNKNTSAPFSRRKIYRRICIVRRRKSICERERETRPAPHCIFLISNGVCDVPDTRAAGAFFPAATHTRGAVWLYYVQSMYLDWCGERAHSGSCVLLYAHKYCFLWVLLRWVAFIIARTRCDPMIDLTYLLLGLIQLSSGAETFLSDAPFD